MKRIKFSKVNITNSDINLVGKVLKTGWLTHGKFTTDFENQFRKYTNSKYAITTSSCTAGLHLSCLASGFKKGDEVMVPAQSHTATAHAVEYTGARVKFVDVDKVTGNITIENIKKNFTKNTRGIIIVHMAGYPCEIREILEFCNKRKIILLEDCAHAVGTRYKDNHVGNFGHSGSFSFYPTKQITTGEGGIVITNDKKFYKKIKMLKAFGIDKDINNRKKQGEYDVKYLGYNYRMTDFQAVLGLEQIKRYKQNLARRHRIVKRYIKNFLNFKNITHMPYSKDCSYFIFQIFCDKRDLLLKELDNKKIGVSIHYLTALPKMSYYKNKYNLNIKRFKNSDNYGKTNISLPVYPSLKFTEVDRISNIIINFLKK